VLGLETSIAAHARLHAEVELRQARRELQQRQHLSHGQIELCPLRRTNTALHAGQHLDEGCAQHMHICSNKHRLLPDNGPDHGGEAAMQESALANRAREHNLLGANLCLSERLSADLAVENDAAHALCMRQEPLARGLDVVHVARRDHRPLEQIRVLSVDHGAKSPADASCPHPEPSPMVSQCT